MVKIKGRTFEEWQEDYHKIEVVDLKQYLSKNNFETLKKLEIKIKDKIYTGYEFECLKLDISIYYTDDNMDEEEKQISKSINEKNVTQEEFNDLIKAFEKIEDEIDM